VDQSNFNDYEVLRMDDFRHYVHIVPSAERPGGGRGGVPLSLPRLAMRSRVRGKGFAAYPPRR
jgi:hypothetical protein